ncbi:DUF421 domain-containing protein [Clostridium chrysemydis]|uniref:YetF domain-containing protein n=1 Tax=Clostridium chrysemydis TaxID=2665504 RepID=UPI0018840470|nr:DUF421 domain-containing protein [Clostridium chrysemydis]
MFIIFIRTVILYILVICVMRLMGKRQVGELQPYEFVITIMISDLASLPMQDTRLPLLLGVIPILTLLLMKMILSQIQLKSQVARRVIDGEPSILIYKSKINYNALKNQQINIDELLEEIRLSGYFDLEDIQYAILETNGHISILPRDTQNSELEGPASLNKYNNTIDNSIKPNSHSSKDNSSPLNTQDSNASKTISGNESNHLFLPKVLISDGKINKNSLTKINKDEIWVKDKLKEFEIYDIKKVLIALYDTRGNFKFQLYDEFEKEMKS